MKIHKKMLVAGLILIMLLAISGCGRKNIKIALYQYTENEDGTLTITALTDKGRSEDELVVPAVLDGKSVSTIGDGAFRDDTMIKKVTIEQGITYISSNAFLSCYNLEEIVIPESVEDIGTHAFTETRWRAEKLKDSNDIIVNNILYEADQNKENYSIKDGVFYGYDELDNERIDLDFCWVPLEDLKKGNKVYPLELIPYILETAKIELQERIGAVKFEIKSIGVYSVTGKTRVNVY